MATVRRDEHGNERNDDWLEGDDWLEEQPSEQRATAREREQPGPHRRPIADWDRRRLALAGLLALAVVVLAVVAAVALFGDGNGEVADRTPAASEPARTETQPTDEPALLPERGRIAPGDRGRSVRRLQRALTRLGYETGRADGAFGPRTLRALRRVQRDAGLQLDGVAGPKTLRALNTELRRRS